MTGFQFAVRAILTIILIALVLTGIDYVFLLATLPDTLLNVFAAVLGVVIITLGFTFMYRIWKGKK